VLAGCSGSAALAHETLEELSPSILNQIAVRLFIPLAASLIIHGAAPFPEFAPNSAVPVMASIPYNQISIVKFCWGTKKWLLIELR